MDDEKIDLVFEPFTEDLELKIEEKEELRYQLPHNFLLERVCVPIMAEKISLQCFLFNKLQVGWQI